MKQRSTRIISVKWILFLRMSFFALGALFSHSGIQLHPTIRIDVNGILARTIVTKPAADNDVMGQVLKTHEAIETLDKAVAMLQMKLATSRRNQEMKNWDATGAFSTLALAHNGSKSATSNSILDRAIDSEDAEHKDFLRLEHVEGYHELSAKTYFSTAVTKWDAEFYIKVDDDVHVNLGKLAATLGRHRYKPGVYIGCMKSGPFLSKKPILHKYANEDVSLSSWFIGLEVEHVDDRSMCCRTPTTRTMLKKSVQTVSGRHKKVIHVLHHSIGAAAEYADRSRGCNSFI
ncbi:hypothetical protein F3Y22_tig00112236pilonHSYRG00046 [Hibiscus syriacus]|uniref:Hexosyltransferase n=1 Tax=Hibiscus syriacus TaxID=106335 RepID=A0A6A2X3Y0_HIBSY|nr:hypothetical protein F3Y22_tig00112236pilonHSYRG00046 [Hibiscus syriacus]